MNIVEPIRKKTDLKKIEKILKKNGLRDLLIFTIGTNCGLRISDILNLNVGDVRNKTYKFTCLHISCNNHISAKPKCKYDAHINYSLHDGIV